MNIKNTVQNFEKMLEFRLECRYYECKIISI